MPSAVVRYVITDPPLSSRFPAGREGRLQRARGEAASKKPEKTPQSGSSELQSLGDDGRTPGSPDSGGGEGSDAQRLKRRGPSPFLQAHECEMVMSIFAR